jgi:hypothetical protein
VIPISSLRHVNVVVRDLEATARGCALIHGIERWRVHRSRDGVAWAIGTNTHGMTLRLVRPAEGGSGTFSQFAARRGEGIHGLCLTELPGADHDPLLRRLGEAGIGVEEERSGGCRRSHLDTRAALGLHLEVLSRGGGDEGGEEWDLGSEVERPPDLPDMGRLWHVGTVVERIDATTPGYERLLGVSGWRRVDFRPEPGSLERSTLDGEPVRHAFSVCKAPLGDTEMELIEPVTEPTHYRRELLDRSGEGVHHLLVLPSLDVAEWARLREWMGSIGVPVAMSGAVRSGAAEFFYLDTRRLLGGYLLEAICRPGDR